MNSGKFVGRNLVIRIVLASTLTFPLWHSEIALGGDAGDGRTEVSNELVLTTKREARRLERRARYAVEPRFRAGVNAGTNRNHEVIVDLGQAPTAEDVMDAVGDAVRGSVTESAQGCIDEGMSSGGTASPEDCLNDAVDGAAADAEGAAQDAVLDAAHQMVRSGQSNVYRIGADARYRLARDFPLYASASAEAGIVPGADMPVFLAEGDTALQLGRSGARLRDGRIVLHPVSTSAGPNAPRELSFLGLEAGLGVLNAKFEPLYCPELPVGEQDEASMKDCMRRYSGELGTSEDSFLAMGLSGGYARGDDDSRWIADAKARATAQFRIKGVGIRTEGYAGLTAGVDGEEIYAAPTIGANVTVTSRARRSE